MNNGDTMRQGVLYDVLAALSSECEPDPVAQGVPAWELLIEQLSPLIGESGLCALFARARHLTSPQSFPHPVHSEMRTCALLLEQLDGQLSGLEPAARLVLNRALLDTFIRLLSGLIGEALTTRLLNTAWAARPQGNLS